MFVGNLVAQSEFDNDYGTMTMGMGIGRELNKYGKRDFFDFEDYDQVCYNFLITRNSKACRYSNTGIL